MRRDELRPPSPAEVGPAPHDGSPRSTAPVNRQEFSAFVKVVRRLRPTLSGSLAHVRPIVFEPGRVVIGCETQFDAHTLGGDETRRWLAETLTEHFGQPTEVRVDKIDKSKAQSPADAPKTLDEIDVDARDSRRAGKAREAASRPAIKALREELQAEIKRVRVIDDN